MDRSVTVEFHDLSVDVTIGSGRSCCGGATHTKRILEGVSGIIRPGDAVALMGASGAGKTTLLNVLSRRNRKNGGEVLINGVPADKSPTLDNNSCYIQQEDIFYSALNIEEHLYSQAGLRLALPKAGRIARVENVMYRLGMLKTRHNQIGGAKLGKGISRNERKRLSVASELLNNPSLIFADEPTSGLDASMAESVVSGFVSLAAEGHTVICTIHQPSTDVYKLFNKLILLSEGRVVYNGPRAGADVYLARVGLVCPPFTNPADYYLEALAIDWEKPDEQLALLDKLIKSWETSERPYLEEWESTLKHALAQEPPDGEAKELVEADSFVPPLRKDGTPKKISSFRISWIMCQRAWLQMVRDPSMLLSTTLVAMTTATIAGLVYWRIDDAEYYSKVGAAFFILTNQGIPAVNMVLLSFLEGKNIARREKESGLYRPIMYFWIQCVVDLFRLTLNPFLFTTIGWYMMGLEDQFTKFLSALFVVWLCSLAMSGYGYIVAAASPSAGVAFSIGPMIVLIFLFVTGFMISLDSLPSFWTWLVHLSPQQYTFSAIVQVIYAGKSIPCDPDDPVAICSGDEVVDMFTSGYGYFVCCGALLGTAVITRIIGSVCLVATMRKKENE